MKKPPNYLIYPIVPLRDTVVFPKTTVSFFVGRNRSIKAIERGELLKHIVIVAQKNPTIDEPSEDDLYSVGALATISSVSKMPDDSYKIVAEVYSRVEIVTVVTHQECLGGLVKPMLFEIDHENVETSSLVALLLEAFVDYANANSKISQDMVQALRQTSDIEHILGVIINCIALATTTRQALLEETNVNEMIKNLIIEIHKALTAQEVENKLKEDVKERLDKNAREYYLNEQMKVIQKELGNGAESFDGELKQLRRTIEESHLSKEARERAIFELSRLKHAGGSSAEGNAIRTYLDHLLALPWNIYTRNKTDIKEAAAVLERDHYGMEKVKERILEFLSVQKRMSSSATKAPILCFVGPPGVGKTSLAKSIAEAVGRNFVRFSLGGIRDEAEIRGHRRTYIASMPGKILYMMKKAKSSNPLILLDEIDKMTADYRGDPAAALLEVLDPEQNDKFMDAYLEVEFDLSKVMFVATANSTDIPPALLDRMEIIQVDGYTEEEKVAIAEKHLLHRQMKDHALNSTTFKVSSACVRDIVRCYTRESGVRGLDKELAKLARKRVREIEEGKSFKAAISTKNIEQYLGHKKFVNSEKERESLVGVSTGLAYTSVGGQLLHIEVSVVPGSGNILATGKLGEVMSESVKAAFTYFKTRARQYGIDINDLKDKDLHLHAPEGAVPKDGPSAGIAIFTAIASALTKIPVRHDVAMTGEITLRGRVLQIGGLKEKLLAAVRGGIKKVLIPTENARHLDEISKDLLDKIEVVPISSADLVLKHTLLYPPVPLVDGEQSAINAPIVELPMRVAQIATDPRIESPSESVH